MVNTFVATAAAGLSWMIVEFVFKWKMSLLGLVSGVVAGLVAVTPAAGFVGPMGAACWARSQAWCACSSARPSNGCSDTMKPGRVRHPLHRRHRRRARHRAAGQPRVRRHRHPRLRRQPGAAKVAEYVRDVQLIAQAKAVGLTLLWSGIGSAIIFKVVDILIGARIASGSRTSRARPVAARRARLRLRSLRQRTPRRHDVEPTRRRRHTGCPRSYRRGHPSIWMSAPGGHLRIRLPNANVADAPFFLASQPR